MKKFVGSSALPALLLTAMLTAGCGTQSPSPAGAGEVEAPASAAALATDDPRAPVTEEPLLDSPLQAYRLTATELATVYFAKNVLVEKCMERFGFEYPQQESFSDALHTTLTQERWDLSRVYGVSNRAWAEEYGYGLPPAPHDTPAPQASEASEPTEAFEFVLRGQRRAADGSLPVPPVDLSAESPGEVDGQQIPPGGCSGEARHELGTSDPNISDYGYAHDLWVTGDSEVKASREYRDVISDWSACLAAEGYTVTDPLADEGDIAEARQRPGASDTPDYVAPSQREIELAVADVECKDEVNLSSRVREVENKVAQAAIEENQLALEADRKRLDDQVRAASQIVEKYGS